MFEEPVVKVLLVCTKYLCMICICVLNIPNLLLVLSPENQVVFILFHFIASSQPPHLIMK